MKNENLILTAPPLTYYNHNKKEKEFEQKEFRFMDETPPTKLFEFIDENKQDVASPR